LERLAKRQAAIADDGKMEVEEEKKGEQLLVFTGEPDTTPSPVEISSLHASGPPFRLLSIGSLFELCGATIWVGALGRCRAIAKSTSGMWFKSLELEGFGHRFDRYIGFLVTLHVG
jgi:hypothetical protein